MEMDTKRLQKQCSHLSKSQYIFLILIHSEKTSKQIYNDDRKHFEKSCLPPVGYRFYGLREITTQDVNLFHEFIRILIQA